MVSLDYRRAWGRQADGAAGYCGYHPAVLSFLVGALQRNEASLHGVYTPPPGRAAAGPGGGAAAGRRSGEPARGRKHCPRPSIGHALPRQGHRSPRNGTCDYTGQCM